MGFPFEYYTIPLDRWVDVFVNDYLVPALRDVFDGIRWFFDQILTGINGFLDIVPPIVLLLLILIIAWRAASWRVALFSTVALLLLGFLGVWEEAMTTLSMILTAVVFCALVGIPIGILAARSDKFEGVLRPVLDAMQTIPPFVYLVPIVMLFRVGQVPGTIATFVFAVPPIIRLTNLGIRQVNVELVEAAYAFGSTPMQVLREIQIPLALRTIMAGLNQTLMLALSMVVIAALIGGGGLGEIVWVALGRIDIGTGFVGGLAIVILAIVLDRITQGLGQPGAPGRLTLLQILKRGYTAVLGLRRPKSAAG